MGVYIRALDFWKLPGTGSGASRRAVEQGLTPESGSKKHRYCSGARAVARYWSGASAFARAVLVSDPNCRITGTKLSRIQQEMTLCHVICAREACDESNHGLYRGKGQLDLDPTAT